MSLSLAKQIEEAKRLRKQWETQFSEEVSATYLLLVSIPGCQNHCDF